MADVQAAWIAASASIAVSLVSLAGTFWTAQRSRELAREQARVGENLARLNSSLSAENDAAKAKRDYEDRGSQAALRRTIPAGLPPA